MTRAIDGFTGPRLLEEGEIELPVYTSEEGEKPLIVLHELPGMTPAFVDYCRDMAGKRFKVYMPLIVGEPERKMENAELRKLCLSREFRGLFWSAKSEDRARPFTKWILALVRDVAGRHEGKIGVIGMCLTGSFALVAFADPRVGAVICCQPAYPFLFKIKSLGMTDRQRDDAIANAQALDPPCSRGYKYEKDLFCRNAHIDAIRRHFGHAFDMYPLIPGKGHSTVTADNPDPAVIKDIADFLGRRI